MTINWLGDFVMSPPIQMVHGKYHRCRNEYNTTLVYMQWNYCKDIVVNNTSRDEDRDLAIPIQYRCFQLVLLLVCLRH